jgi:phosphatidylserine decarboxylase
MSVGRIVQVHPLDATYHRGDEKFVFRFGGSVIVVFGEPGAWRANEDIVGHTREGIETFVRLSETVGVRI